MARRTRTRTRRSAPVIRTRSAAPIVRYQPKPIIIQQSAPGISRYRRAGAAIRRGASKAGQFARDQRHTLVAVGAAAGIGLAKRFNLTLPSVNVLGVAGTYGVAAFLAGRFMKNQILEHVATGLLSVAAYEMAASGTLTGDGGTF